MNRQRGIDRERERFCQVNRERGIERETLPGGVKSGAGEDGILG